MGFGHIRDGLWAWLRGPDEEPPTGPKKLRKHEELKKHGRAVFAKPCVDYSLYTYPTKEPTAISVAIQSLIHSVGFSKHTTGRALITAIISKVMLFAGPNVQVIFFSSDEKLTMTDTRVLVARKRPEPKTIECVIGLDELSHPTNILMGFKNAVYGLVDLVMQHLMDEEFAYLFGDAAVLCKTLRKEHSEGPEKNIVVNNRFAEMFPEYLERLQNCMAKKPPRDEIDRLFAALNKYGEDDIHVVQFHHLMDKLYGKNHMGMKQLIYSIDFDVMELCKIHEVDATMIWMKKGVKGIPERPRRLLHAELQQQGASLGAEGEIALEGDVSQFIRVDRINEQLREQYRLTHEQKLCMTFLLSLTGTDYNEKLFTQVAGVADYALYRFPYFCAEGKRTPFIRENDKELTLVTGELMAVFVDMFDTGYIPIKKGKEYASWKVGEMETTLLQVFHYIVYLSLMGHGADYPRPHEFGFSLDNALPHVKTSCMIKRLYGDGTVVPVSPATLIKVNNMRCDIGPPLEELKVGDTNVLWTSADDPMIQDLETDESDEISDSLLSDHEDEGARNASRKRKYRRLKSNRDEEDESDEDIEDDSNWVPVSVRGKKMRMIDEAKKTKATVKVCDLVYHEHTGMFPRFVFPSLMYRFNNADDDSHVNHLYSEY